MSPKLAAHRGHRPVEADLAGDVAKAVGAEVAVEPGPARFLDWHAHGDGRRLGEAGLVVVDVDVEPAVVVKVPEPASEADIGSR